MRFIPTYCLREGMKLGRNLYGKRDELLLSKDTILNQAYIQSIERLNYSGLYIDDDISKDIEIVSVISDTIRMEAVRGIKDVLIKSAKGHCPIDKIAHLQDQIRKMIDEILDNRDLMINMIDLKVYDNYTYHHSVNVAVVSIVLGVAYKLNKYDLFNLGFGALLHDIGKVFVRKEVLNKITELSEEEFAEIKEHSFLGYKYAKDKFNISAYSYIAILDHHERYNGEGYPQNKIGDSISLFGRIIALADVYDALISQRPYRKAMLPSEAIEYIMGNSGTMFDPKLALLFTKKVAPYPIGTTVKLSNGLSGIVTDNFESFGLRPKIRIFKKDQEFVEPFEINLKTDHSYFNTTIVGLADF